MAFVWKFGSLEAWRLGGAPEVEARTAASGGDETARGTAECADLEQIKGVLPHAGRVFGSSEAWRFRGLEEPRRLKPGLPPLAAMRPQGEPQIAQIWSRLRACYRTQDCQCVFGNHKVHKDCQRDETADSTDWSRLGACYRTHLEGWRLESLDRGFARRALVARSVLRSLFSVLRSACGQI